MMTYERSLREDGTTYLPRDFVETCSGLLFAVVAAGTEQGRILGFLRYARRDAALRKLDTAEANRVLQLQQPDYLYHSPQRDVVVHGIPVADVVRHYRPSQRLAEIVQGPCPDALEAKLCRLAAIVGAGGGTPEWLGVTGSLLLAAHQAGSDIDLVCYGREAFAAARQCLQDAVRNGALDQLSDVLWREAYARRGCSLSYDEYLWHERRKHNKFACAGTKVDISCIVGEPSWVRARGEKVCRDVIRGTVADDTFAFDYPARYPLTHSTVGEIVCYTPTYAGQAVAGELVEAAGWVERTADGALRLTVGTSREAAGQYIKVVHTR